MQTGIDQRNQESLFRERLVVGRIAESSPVAIVVQDRAGRVVFTNSAVESRLGLAPDKITPITLIPPGWRMKDAAGKRLAGDRIPFRFVMETGEAVHRQQLEIERVEGGRAWWTFDAMPVLTDDGRIVGVVSFIDDVTASRAAEEHLLQEKAFSDVLIESVPGVFCASNRKFQMVRWNSYMNRLVGRTDDELWLSDALQYVHPDDRAAVQASMEQVFTTGYSETEFRALSKERGVRDFMFRCRRFESGGETFICGFGSDITERKHARIALLESEERYRSLVAALSEGVVLIDASGRVQATNASAERMLGVPLDTKLTSIEFLHEDGTPFLAGTRPSIVALRTGTSVRNQVVGLRTPEGAMRWLSVSAEPLFHVGETKPYAAVVSFSDVTDRKRLEQELERQAQTDPLTGVANRRHFEHLAAHALAESRRYDRPLSLLMIDIDRFKSVNDNFGHAVGDLALKELVRTCRETMREIDIVARTGGEEFLILLPETDERRALQVAERLREAVSRIAIPVKERVLRFTVSIGVAPVRGPGLENSVSLADQALYEAKRMGRGRVHALGH